MPDFRLLANDFVRSLTPYQPGKPIAELERELGITSSIKLASNENPLGASLYVIEALQKSLKHSHIYPDGSCYELKTALSHFLQVEKNQITIGNGSENLLELIIKSYLHKNDNAVISEYAFLTIPILLQSYGVQATVVKAQNYGHDIDKMIAAVNEKTRVIFIVNPNNPTGTYTNHDDLLRLLNNIPSNVLIVVDEAYTEYIAQSDYTTALKYINTYPNLIVLRTFSKVYGLAGLRIGYSVSSPDIADILNRSRLPFNVNLIAESAACAALYDQEHVTKSVNINNEGMTYLKAKLKEKDFEYIPSLGNFISINVGDAVAVYQKLLHEGVIIRPLHAYNLPEFIRVTISIQAHNDRFIEALTKVCQQILTT